MSRRQPRRTKRALWTGVGAALLFGGWAAFANWEHSGAAASRAALAQAGLSFASTTLAVLLLEFLYRQGKSLVARFCFAALGTPVVILGAMAGLHELIGTPDVFETVLPSVLSGALFCVVYTGGLAAHERAAARRHGAR